MPRLYEIEVACRAAIVIEPNGRRILTTRRFLQELERYNWHWSPRQANQWTKYTSRRLRTSPLKRVRTGYSSCLTRMEVCDGV